jgi:hypothetical protein
MSVCPCLCDTLGIDESFWSVLLHGTEQPVTLGLNALIIGDRSVPRGYKGDGPLNPADTADLIAASRAVYGSPQKRMGRTQPGHRFSWESHTY